MKRRLGRVVGCLLGAMVALAAADAQQTQIQPSTISADTISPSQQQEITAFVTEHLARLTSTDPKDVREGRRALLEPLGSPEIKVAFRLAYAERLIPELRRLAQSPAGKDGAIAAIVIAGDLATGDAIDLLTQSLASAREDVRHQAAYGLRRSFEAIARTPAAVAVDSPRRAVRALRDRFAQEPNELVLLADVNALLAALAVEVPGFEPLRTDASGAIARGLAETIRAREGKMDDAALLGVLLRAASTRDVVARSGARLQRESLQDAGTVGGELVAFVIRAVAQGERRMALAPVNPQQIRPGQTPPIRELFAQAAQAGETLILLAGQQMQPGFVEQPIGLGDKLRVGTRSGDATFIADAEKLVGPGGVLSRPPFTPPNPPFKLR